MAVTTAIAIGATVAAGTTAYNAYESHEARDEAKNVASKAEFEAKAAADEAKKRQDEQTTLQKQIDDGQAAQDQQNVLMLANERRRMIYGGSYTKGGTLLTGPQGVTTPGPTINKTLLGA